MNRILFEPFELTDDQRVTLRGSDDRARHIRRILKLSPGDRFRSGVVNGAGAEAIVRSVERDSVEVSLELDEAALLPPYPITVLLSHPRPIVLKRMLKDLTTLGVAEILIFPGERGERSYGESSLWEGEGYRRFLVDGAMQAGSTLIPEVERSNTLSDTLSLLDRRDRAIRLLADEEAPLKHTVSRFLAELGPMSAQEPALVAIGAERGWSGGERELLTEAGFHRFSLGSRVLRTETAAIVVTSTLVEQYHRIS